METDWGLENLAWSLDYYMDMARHPKLDAFAGVGW